MMVAAARHAVAAQAACDRQCEFELAQSEAVAGVDTGEHTPVTLPWEIQCVNEMFHGAQDALAQQLMTRSEVAQAAAEAAVFHDAYVNELREAALEPGLEALRNTTPPDPDDDVEEDAHDEDQQTLIEPEVTQIDNQLEEDILEPVPPPDGATDEDTAAQKDLPRHADVDDPADEEAGPEMQEKPGHLTGSCSSCRDGRSHKS
jgi:hypothetical protein